jgi:hypothetical protein
MTAFLTNVSDRETLLNTSGLCVEERPMFEQRSGVRPGDSVRRKSSLEERLEVRGGVSAYRGPFPLHYLDAVVAPNIPTKLLIVDAAAVCVLNLWIYPRRLRVRDSLG